jgi:hypothetical protein
MKPTFVAALAALALSAGPALAQNIYPYTQPNYGPGYRTPLSPYLNMLRGGDPAANYFLGVQPEFQRRQNAVMFQQQLYNLAGQTGAIATSLTTPEVGLFQPLASTGHPTAFNNTAGYFNTGGSTPLLSGMRPSTPPAGPKAGPKR